MTVSTCTFAIHRSTSRHNDLALCSQPTLQAFNINPKSNSTTVSMSRRPRLQVEQPSRLPDTSWASFSRRRSKPCAKDWNSSIYRHWKLFQRAGLTVSVIANAYSQPWRRGLGALRCSCCAWRCCPARPSAALASPTRACWPLVAHLPWCRQRKRWRSICPGHARPLGLSCKFCSLSLWLLTSGIAFNTRMPTIVHDSEASSGSGSPKKPSVSAGR